MNVQSQPYQELIDENAALKQKIRELEQAEVKYLQAESTLSESERKLREIQEMAHLGYWIWDVRTGKVEWSEEVFRIFQLAADSFTPQIDSILALSPWPGDHERDRELIRKAMESHEGGSYEQRFLRPDKSIGYYISSFQGKYDDNGNLIFIVGTVQDITERKRAEEALSLSQSQLQAVLDASLDAITVVDDQGTFLAGNRVLQERWGRQREQLVGHSASEVLAPEIFASRMERVRQCIASGFSDHFVDRQDNNWFEITIAPIVEADGKIRTVALFSRDITERKQAEDRLGQQIGAVEAAIDGIAILNADQNYIYLNNAHAEIYGYDSPAEIIGKSWRILYENDELRRFDREIMPAFGQHGHYRGVARGKKKDGSTFTQEISLTALDHGGLICVVQDITERKRAEDALRENERRLSTLTSNLPGMVYRCLNDRERTMEFISEGCIALTGYNAVDFVNSHRIAFADLIYSEDRESAWNNVQTAIRGKNKFQMNYRITTADGGMKWVWEQGQGVFSENGELLALEGFITDITEQRQSEDALSQNWSMLEQILNSVPQSIFWKNRSSVYMGCNEVFARRAGLDNPDAIIGKTDFDLPWRHAEAEAYRADDEEVIKQNRPKSHITETQQQADGKCLWIDTTKVPLTDESGQVYGVLGVYEDITEHKRAEEERQKLQAQLNQAQKMESVGRLAGGVAHDFNNMLGVILGRAEMALMRTDATQPLYQDIQEIQKAAERSADLTRQLLAFARKQTVSPSVLDLNEVVESMLKMLRRLIGEDIELVWLSCKNLWPVKMDTSQLDQILVNLCVNAKDAIAGVGKITIETGTTVFDETFCANHVDFVPGDYVLLAVSDDGCGMDEEMLGKLFEPFFTTKGVGQGTGLGLATVYGIVKQNNGFIDVCSKPGSGTTLRIYLPRYMGKTGQIQREGGKATDRGGSETVLLVEDEPAILDMTTQMLERLGYTVLAASRPGEAIRLAEMHSGKIHLLMTDVVMPEMNGRDLAKNILSLYPDIKRLFMSGYTANVIAHQGVLDKGVHFIQKPFLMKNLAAKLRETLDNG